MKPANDLNDLAIDIAKNYYDSADADAFYSSIWGGEDIHIGIYSSPADSIPEASRQTQLLMANRLSSLSSDSKVIDLGSGYGGTARFLAKQYGCSVVALNLSEVENSRARQLNKEQGLEELIDVVDDRFESVPYPDNTFDVVWSQDAFLHSPAREQVLGEATRILKSGGELIFTDPMKSDECPEGVLQPILDRIHLDSLASPSFYNNTAERLGLNNPRFEELTHHLKQHYEAVLKETEKREADLKALISSEYIQNMKKGLAHWINGAQKGYLAWGILHYIK